MAIGDEKAPHRLLAAAILLLASAGAPAQAAVYQCTGPNGEVLITDIGCPTGYSTDLVVADPPPTKPAAPAPRSAAPQPSPSAPAMEAQHQTELELARLRAQLEQQRLDAMDRKLDALLETGPVYGGVVGVPIGAIKPFPLCKGRPGQVAWVNCRPERGNRRPQVSRNPAPSCGIVGCTPSIIRRPGEVP